MLETGIVSATNLALAALPGFTSSDETSESAMYLKQDITQPFVIENGYLNVQNTPDICIEPDIEFLEEIATHKEIIE